MYPGIYYVRGKVPFPVQVVVTSQLERKAHCSLRVLTTQVEMQDAGCRTIFGTDTLFGK